MAGILDFLSGLNNMLGAATYTRPQDIAAVRGLLPQSVDNAAQTAFASPPANDALGLLGGLGMASGARTFWRGQNPGDARRISTGTPFDNYLFMADNPDAASMYGKQLTKYQAAPDAKILYEGTPEFKKLVGNQKNGESLLDFANRASEAAKSAGYDALWFQRQGDVGTAVFNPQKFTASE